MRKRVARKVLRDCRTDWRRRRGTRVATIYAAWTRLRRYRVREAQLRPEDMITLVYRQPGGARIEREHAAAYMAEVDFCHVKQFGKPRRW